MTAIITTLKFYKTKVLARFGDYYHDKGRERAESYSEGFADALGKTLKVEQEEVADRD